MRIDKSALRADLLSELTVRPGRKDDRARPVRRGDDRPSDTRADRRSHGAESSAPMRAPEATVRPIASPSPESSRGAPLSDRPVPLSSGQIEAAGRLYEQLVQWRAGDEALAALAERFPGFDAQGSLLKVVTVGALYGSTAINAARLAGHVQRVLAKADARSCGSELVERLAAVPAAPGESKARMHLAFASKFAHFFVDPDRYPIMDTHAVRMVRFHLGRRNRVSDEAHRYVEFVTNFRRLRAMAGFKGPKRELDRYLWLSGRYQAWLKNPKSRVNVELGALFRSPNEAAAVDLRAMMQTDDAGVAWL